MHGTAVAQRDSHVPIGDCGRIATNFAKAVRSRRTVDSVNGANFNQTFGAIWAEGIGFQIARLQDCKTDGQTALSCVYKRLCDGLCDQHDRHGSAKKNLGSAEILDDPTNESGDETLQSA